MMMMMTFTMMKSTSTRMSELPTLHSFVDRDRLINLNTRRLISDDDDVYVEGEDDEEGEIEEGDDGEVIDLQSELFLGTVQKRYCLLMSSMLLLLQQLFAQQHKLLPVQQMVRMPR